MPVAESPFTAASESAPPHPRRRRRDAFWVASLAFLAIGCAIGLLDRAVFSPAETVAVIRQRRALAPDEDAASAIEQIAGQILAPANLVAALRESAEPQSEESLAAAAESLRRRLRVEVDPGAGRQPWTISIRCLAGQDGDGDAQIVNRLAESYAQARKSADVANRQRSYEAARTASQRAERLAEQSLRDFDRQIDRLPQLPAPPRRQPAARSEAAVQARTESPHKSEISEQNSEQRAELELQRAELEARRSTMLERLLPAHPEVLAIDSEIETLLGRLNQLPPETPSSPAEQQTEPDGAPLLTKEVPDAESKRALAELNSRRKSLADALSRASQFAAAERLAADQMLHNGQDEIIALSPALPSSPPSRTNWSLVAITCSAGLLAGWAVGRWRQGPSDAFRDADELESALGVPLIGVLEGC